ncbi:ATP-dependent nuclease [Luteibacter aegosomatissinici]|uniref:ATP-dependent nuclease n=1 Tax=Luteibacter aegosomatissinici TaxID=2911539 RepID=UPI001FF7DD3F|nr:TOPRIM nucleotidyl transferase/hydrolase domain-containing protein [Luteibacter aegosomatissinici]UPG94304.1 AAA family ATPase [Luteibacter aegosomatissinici]
MQETLSGDFYTLAVRPDILIKVRERLRKLFRRDISIEWQQGTLRVQFTSEGSTEAKYTSGREASGLIHLVGILAAIYDDDVGALLLDEPEVSLHPQLQSFLRREIEEASGAPDDASYKKIIVLCTHSTEFVKINTPLDLTTIVLCQALSKQPIQINPETPELLSKKMYGLAARLGHEHKSAFFANRPLLVEGPSDAIICGALSGRLDLPLEAAGVQIVPVIGKGEFPLVSKLFRLLGKNPAILLDADGIADGLSTVNSFLHTPSAVEFANSKLGQESAIHFSKQVYDAFSKLVQNRWHEIESLAVKHPYWSARSSQDDDLTPKLRATFSTLFQCQNDSLSCLSSDGAWQKIKARLTLLLDLLESQGCFVLRKGTIESYYANIASSEKVLSAATEASSLGGRSVEEVSAHFDDIVRCLTTVAAVPSIVEADSLQDTLLRVAVPILARFQNGERGEDLVASIGNAPDRPEAIFSFTASNDKIEIDLNSKVLKVPGFPMSFTRKSNIVAEITRSIGTRRKSSVDANE